MIDKLLNLLDRHMTLARRENRGCDFVTGSFTHKSLEVGFEFGQFELQLDIKNTENGRWYPNVAGRLEGMCLRWEDIEVPDEEESVFEANGFTDERDLIHYLYA